LARIPLEKLCSGRDDILLYKKQSSSTSAGPSDDPFENVLDDPLVITLLHSQHQHGSGHLH
jgi:hypothetical protein